MPLLILAAQGYPKDLGDEDTLIKKSINHQSVTSYFLLSIFELFFSHIKERRENFKNDSW